MRCQGNLTFRRSRYWAAYGPGRDADTSSEAHLQFLRAMIRNRARAEKSPAFARVRPNYYSFAPCFFSRATISVWPPFSARDKAVRPRLSFTFTSAPLLTSSSMTSKWPAPAAVCKGVWPALVCALTSAPLSIRNSATSLWPPAAAECRAVHLPCRWSY